MKKKIEMTDGEKTMVIAALIAYDNIALALKILERFSAASESTDDGPEVEILLEPR